MQNLKSGWPMWMRFASVIIFSFFLSACSLLSTKPEVVDNQQGAVPLTEEVIDAFGVALELMSEEKYQEASDVLIPLSEANPTLTGVWANLAICQQQLEQYEDAVTSASKAVAINPDFCAAHKIKGINLREIGKFEEAKEAYISAIQCDPQDMESMYNLGVLLDLYIHKQDQALYCYMEYQKAYQSKNEEADKTVSVWIKTLARKLQPVQPPELVVPVPVPSSSPAKTEEQLAGSDSLESNKELVEDKDSIAADNNVSEKTQNTEVKNDKPVEQGESS